MRILLVATALTLSGSALAYQTYPAAETDPAVAVTTTTVAVDPTVAISPLPTWNDEQRTLWEQHMAFTPATWTVEERAAFAAMMAVPPVNWTAEQRALYEQHYAMLPSSWTAAQRAAYAAQIASLRTPWLSATQTAATTTTTTLAAAPASPRVVQPSNADPEHDARGIAVISAPAVVPDGYNGFSGTATGMGGPLVDPATGQTIQGADASYPACTATVTDNCIQLYERGVRASLASYNRSRGGMGGPVEEGNDNTPEDDAIDVDTRPDGTLDVDGDLDGDGDNDIE